MERLGLDQRTNDEAGVERDPLWKEERRVLDCEDATRGRGATARARHLSWSVERARDADANAEA